MENKKLLEVKNLVVEYKTDTELVKAVNGVNLSLNVNEALGIVGETGAGKTTTCRAIIGLIQTPPGRVMDGEIYFEGENLLKKKERDMRKVRGNDITMVFQDPMTSLNPSMTVGDQIMEVIRLHDKISKAEAIVRAKEMLEMVGIPAERANEYPHQFSGGMKQRVLIAIALACNPKVLIADEPTTALDVTIQAQVLEMMSDLKEKLGTALVMITHDLGVVAQICDSVAVMYAGRIVESGTLRDVFKSMMHPYTEGLFNSLPNINDRKSELIPIPGMMPDPTKLPKGCAFAPRCKYATDKCRECRPDLVKVSDTHSVSCWAYEDPDFCLERRKNNG